MRRFSERQSDSSANGTIVLPGLEPIFICLTTAAIAILTIEISGCVHRPPLKPRSVAESIEQKFRLAAELRADAVRRDGALTETHWTNTGRPPSGPFEFNYDYQRADLQVSAPPFYELHESFPLATAYTSARMGAISALLMAIGRVFSNAGIIVHPESYAETIELVDSFAIHLRKLPGSRPARQNETSRTPCPRILLLDYSIRTRRRGSSMCWDADDCHTGECSSVARDRLHRYAQRLSSLALQVQEVLHKDPLGGHLFVFRGRRSDLVKAIWKLGSVILSSDTSPITHVFVS